VVASILVMVSTVAWTMSPVPLIAATIPSFTVSIIPECFVCILVPFVLFIVCLLSLTLRQGKVFIPLFFALWFECHPSGDCSQNRLIVGDHHVATGDADTRNGKR